MDDYSQRAINLELKMRQTNGDAFQTFFSDVMQARFSDDFVRIRPYGALGDKGCDGYLKSTGEVYQCYGAVNGSPGKVSDLTKKMKDDFKTAKEKIGDTMKAWTMVHNVMDGSPYEAVQTMKEMETDNPDIKFGFFAFERFFEIINELNENRVALLIGPTAKSADALNLQPEDLRDLIHTLMHTLEEYLPSAQPLEPVSPEKLEHNKLPKAWQTIIEGGWINAHLVKSYIDQHFEADLGEAIAQQFQRRYEYLKAQKLAPGSIMAGLYQDLIGPDMGSGPRQVAAQALLAHLFESCDIFENAPKKAAQQ